MEGDKIISLEPANLGERINKALATRIDQLNVLNKNEKIFRTKRYGCDITTRR